jgi:RNA polymerase sigma factor (sigma-70 family)
MGLSTVSQVLEFAHMATGYVKKSFGLDHDTAADVVQDVLLRLYRSDEEHLDHPKQYFFRACRWRALQLHRRRRHQNKAFDALKHRQEKLPRESEVLVALEDEDKPKFFEQATPKQQEVFELLIEGHSQTEVSAILEIPESTVRMRIHLAKKRFGNGAA